MQVLTAHNDYGKFSGEEQAVETAAGVLSENGHLVRWLRESSAGIESSFSGKIDAFFSAFYSKGARRRMAGLLDRFPIDLVHVQNLYPFLSPSILIPLPRARRPGGDALPELPPVLPQRPAPVAGRGLRSLLARITWTGMKL